MIRFWFGKIWGIWGLVSFFSLVILFFPFYVVFLALLPARYARVVIWFNHHVFPYLWFPLIGIWLRVRNRQLIDPRQRYIIISNHRTAIDFVANPVAFPGIYKFLAKKELTKVPLLGFIVKRVCILVDRTSSASTAKSLQWLKKTVREGYSVFLYPEGTRNKTDQPLASFFPGAFRLSKEMDLPMAVMVLPNVLQRCQVAKGIDMWPGMLDIHWCGVLYPKDFPDHKAMMDAARELMAAHLGG